MINRNQIVQVVLDSSESLLVRQMTLLACTGGKSQIFQDQQERNKRRLIDNAVGQAGELAINILAFQERDFGKTMYINSRNKANANPHLGDDGMDILDTHIDVKTSMIRSSSRSQDMLSYNLVVRPQEFKEGWVYVLGLIYQKEITDPKIVVNIIGWAHSDDFPDEIETQGLFKNTFPLRASNLNPLPLPDYLWSSNLRPHIKKNSEKVLTF